MDKQILMITESAFPEDVRIRHEAETLVQAGYRITVISLNERKASFSEVKNGIKIYRLPMITLFQKSSTSQTVWGRILFRLKSGFGYIVEYIYFTVFSFLMSLYIFGKQGFDIVHIHNPPNTLFLVAGFYKLFGKKFVFDHHDLAPELYLSKYRAKKDVIYRILLLEEKMCLLLSDMVIATNESYKEIDIQRGQINKTKVVVVRNGPDFDDFKRVPADQTIRKMKKNILVYIGIMGPQDGLDYLLRALHHVVYGMKKEDIFCIIIGTGDALYDLKDMSKMMKLDKYVWFTGFIPRSDLLKYLSTADICLDPNPSSPLNDVSTWIKVMEYMAMGKPVISFDLKETRNTAKQAAIYVEPNNVKKYAQAITDLFDAPQKRKQMGDFGRMRVQEKLAWKYSAKHLVTGYIRLLI